MPAVPAPAKVLVSGANGYVATWVIRTLLDHGYSVRGTVRSESKTTALKKLFKSEVVVDGKLEFVIVKDIAKPGAFDEAVKGVDAVEHMASPFHLHADDPEELVGPAVQGTVGMLESALKYGGPQLKRIVITSSCAAIFDQNSQGVLTESDWNEGDIKLIHELGREADNGAKYCASKSLAEKAAWEFVTKNASSLTYDIITLCPSYVFGPILNPISSPSELGTSMQMFYDAVLSNKEMSEDAKKLQSGWVDVRDVALAHAKAIEVPEAGGQRFILNGGMFTFQDFLDTANELGIEGISKGSLGEGKSVKYKYTFDNSKARNVLSLPFRDMPMLVKETYKNLKEHGL